MKTPSFSRKKRLILTIGISLAFFVTELAIGFYTHSLALIADSFHYLSDLIGIVVALVALLLQERTAPPKYTYGWQRATLLGAFFNGVFLMALSVSIFVQAVERFINITHVENPMLVLIVGGVGLALNVLVLSFLHEHDHDHGHGHDHGLCHDDSHSHRHSHSFDDDPEHGHGHDGRIALSGREQQDSSDGATNAAAIDSRTVLSPSVDTHHEHNHNRVVAASPGRDLGMLGAFIHVLGDAINNVGVIIAAVIIWKATGEGRYYADPAIGIFIALMIMVSGIPLVKSSGAILLQSAPGGIDLQHLKHDIEKIPGIESVHELHIWRLNQRKSIASAHIVVDCRTVNSFTDKAKIIMECLRAYGIHSATLQPEVSNPDESPSAESLATGLDGGPNNPTSEQPQPSDQSTTIPGQLDCSTRSESAPASQPSGSDRRADALSPPSVCI